MNRTAVRIDPALVVILAGISAALHIGKLPPALPVLQQVLGVTLMQAGFLLALVQLAGMSLGLFMGLAADTLGLRRSMLLGLCLLAAASFMGGLAQQVPVLLFWRAVEGLGFLLVVLPAPSLIRQLVAPQRMSIMLGVWGTYMPWGTATALLLGPWLIGVTSWSVWWWVMSGISLLMAIWVWRAVPDSTVSQLAPGMAAGGWLRLLQQTLRASGPWLIALSFAMYSGQWLAVVGFLPTIYAESGWTGHAMALLTASVAGINMVGNLASGRLLVRGVPAHYLLYTGFAAMGLCTLITFAFDGLASGWRFLAVLLFSAVGGVIPGTLFSLAVRLAPAENAVSTTVGWMQQWSAAGQFAGPPLVAWVASQAGGWQLTWLVTASCALFGIGLAWLIANRLKQGVS